VSGRRGEIAPKKPLHTGHFKPSAVYPKGQLADHAGAELDGTL